MNIIKGDLIELAKQSKFQLIGQGCNCFNTMGGGIALQIKNEFPNAFFVDSMTVPGDWKKLGDYTSCYYPKLDLTVLNIYSQYTFGKGKQVEYHALYTALKKINERYRGMSIGLPWLGTGLAGGSKEIILDIIESTLVDMDVTIVEYEPNS